MSNDAVVGLVGLAGVFIGVLMLAVLAVLARTDRKVAVRGPVKSQLVGCIKCGHSNRLKGRFREDAEYWFRCEACKARNIWSPRKLGIYREEMG